MGIHDGHRENMRQRFLHTGLEGFADHEALELLLYYAIPRRDTNPIAHTLIERYGSLSAVLSASVEDLSRVEGMGPHAAVLLSLTARLCQKARLSDNRPDVILNTTRKAARYLEERLDGERNEVIYQLCLDRKGKLLSCKRLSEGGVAEAGLDIRKLVENALVTAASSVILAHNHPSGVALPSQDDYAATERAKTALAMVGVALIDHIIVADGDSVSMADSGFFHEGF